MPTVYPGMVQMPGYQPAMMPAPMPMMPAMGTVPAMPGTAGLGHWVRPQVGIGGGRILPGAQRVQWAEGCKLGHGIHLPCPPAMLTAMAMPPQPQSQPLLPSVDVRQLATQQQSFINQQALILVRVCRAPGLPGGDSCVGQGQASSYLTHPLPSPSRLSR